MLKSRFSFKRYGHAFLFCSQPERLVVEEIGNGVQIFAKKELESPASEKRQSKLTPMALKYVLKRFLEKLECEGYPVRKLGRVEFSIVSTFVPMILMIPIIITIFINCSKLAWLEFPCVNIYSLDPQPSSLSLPKDSSMHRLPLPIFVDKYQVYLSAKRHRGNPQRVPVQTGLVLKMSHNVQLTKY